MTKLGTWFPLLVACVSSGNAAASAPTWAENAPHDGKHRDLASGVDTSCEGLERFSRECLIESGAGWEFYMDIDGPCLNVHYSTSDFCRDQSEYIIFFMDLEDLDACAPEFADFKTFDDIERFKVAPRAAASRGGLGGSAELKAP